ncbi:MAG: HAMP domain-containing histidine kinase [Actinomycetota bacterium]|nr:HAMP domain-containing histidine kinase [Actinomycetota bacterium]
MAAEQERERAREQQSSSGEDLGEEARARSELTSMIAHELKNPLMSIKGLAATGSRLYDSMTDEERKDFFRLIDVESSRLKLIVDEISTALKIDAGQLAYAIRPEALGRLVEETAWRFSAGDHPLRVETDEELTVPIDRGRMEETLTNLLDNAAKFSAPDAPIVVRAFRTTDGSATVEVLDRGPGIPSEQRSEVFRKFNRYRPPGYEEVPGAGLGLFISAAHIKAHGGRIDIEDGSGQGTMLRLTVPSGG